MTAETATTEQNMTAETATTEPTGSDCAKLGMEIPPDGNMGLFIQSAPDAHLPHPTALCAGSMLVDKPGIAFVLGKLILSQQPSSFS